MDKIQWTGILLALLGMFVGLPVMLTVMRDGVDDFTILLSTFGVGLICFGGLVFASWTLVKLLNSPQEAKESE